jgi:hypothetical protein
VVDAQSHNADSAVGNSVGETHMALHDAKASTALKGVYGKFGDQLLKSVSFIFSKAMKTGSACFVER